MPRCTPIRSLAFRLALGLLVGLSTMPTGARAQQLAPTPPPTSARWSDEELRVRCLSIAHLSDWFYGRDEDVLELARGATTAQVEALLGDVEGRVRAVAVVLLHEHLGHRAVEQVAPLMRDNADAPPRRDSIHRPLQFQGGALLPAYEERPQDVAAIAVTVVSSYVPLPLQMRFLGADRVIDGAVLQRALQDYLRTRHERAWSWSRIAHLAKRLSGGISPTPAGRLPDLARLRAAIDEAPLPARHWYLLGLACGSEFGGAREHFATDADRVAALRALGPDVLLRFLAGHAPGDDGAVVAEGAVEWPDPDASAARMSGYPWQAIAGFALAHGAEWFPRERLDDWVALAERHFRVEADGRTIGGGQYPLGLAGWWTTAARLDPERASHWIDRGFEVLRAQYRGIERGHVAFAAACLLGDDGVRRAVEWFFVGEAASTFYDDLGSPEGRALLAAILRDERLGLLSATPLRGLALACNAQRGDGPAPFGEREPWDLQHPFGVDSYSTDPAAAAAKWPAESRELERTLAEWRKRMRAFAVERLR